jgi:hypothetical protein
MAIWCRNEDLAPISSLCNAKNPMILSSNSLADSKVPRRVPPADRAVQLTPRWQTTVGFPEADGMGPSLLVRTNQLLGIQNFDPNKWGLENGLTTQNWGLESIGTMVDYGAPVSVGPSFSATNGVPIDPPILLGTENHPPSILWDHFIPICTILLALIYISRVYEYEINQYVLIYVYLCNCVCVYVSIHLLCVRVHCVCKYIHNINV